LPLLKFQPSYKQFGPCQYQQNDKTARTGAICTSGKNYE